MLTFILLGSDEILFNAQIHPEQYSNTLSVAQVSQLHKSLHYVISHAVDTLVEWDSFPASWLFKHRWDKGKKNSPSRLANGAKIEFVTVGGRTSALVPSVQKKTGPVAGDVKHEPNGEDDQGDEASEEDQGKKKSKGMGKKKADSNPTIQPSASKKHETHQENPTIPPVRKRVASASKTYETRQENTTKPSRAKRQPSNPSSPIDEPGKAHTTQTENVPSASKKRAHKPEPEDEIAEARGHEKKSKDEAAADLIPRRRSARVSGMGGRF